MSEVVANNGMGSSSPDLVIGPYSAAYESRNIVHELIGGGTAAALATPRPRSGEIRYLYHDEADAFAAVALHRNESTFTLTVPERPTVGMTYIVNGRVTIELDAETRTEWVVAVTYEMVDPGASSAPSGAGFFWDLTGDIDFPLDAAIGDRGIDKDTGDVFIKGPDA